MAEDPAIDEEPECMDMVCFVELACESLAPGQRRCEGSGYAVDVEWDEEQDEGWWITITEADRAESRYLLCANPGTAEESCERPRYIEGTLADVELLTFKGGALLVHSPVRREEPAAPTYRIVADAPAGYFNVRAGPGTSYNILSTVPAGTGGIRGTGECRPPEVGKGSVWCPVELEGSSGWISSTGLEIEETEASE
jgi:hypothetical protein